KDYGIKGAKTLLMASRNERHLTEQADLHGKRLVFTVETDEGRRLDEATVKELVGGDRVRARRMRENFFESQPTHKIILATNHKPKVHGTDFAIWRRLQLVPFGVKFEGERKDKTLPAKLLAELPGILAWCVRGCLEWQERGLGPP